MRFFVRLLRGALAGGAVALYFSACGVPEFGFQEQGTGGAAGTSSGGTAGDGSAATGGSAGDAGTDVTTEEAGPTGCTGDPDCAATPTLPICDTSTSKCVECLPTKGTCPTGTYCAATVCKVGCDDDTDCAGQSLDASASGDASDPDAGDAGDAEPADAGALTCDKTKNLCVGCSLDSQCPLGTVCDTANGTCIPGCTTTATCPSGFDCCAKQCVNLDSNVDHCSACDTPCKPTGGTGKCEAGVCKVDKCDSGLADCNGNGSDGCEVTLSLDPLHCGACGKACAEPANANATCQNGNCGMGACKPDFENCDNNPANGCEVNKQTSVSNCGACNLVCDLLNANEVCTAGACGVGSCVAGFADCDKTASNGCEVNTQTNTDNCGACNAKCDFPNGAGACSSGSCALTNCVTPWKDCDLQAANGCEKNLNTDATNCGTCGNSCSNVNGTPSCNNGSCAIACNNGFGDCTTSAGCETNTNTSTGHCGGCGNACSSNNGTPSCNAGACQIACTTGYANCDGDVTDGCEINTNTNVNHCGACNNKCPSPSGGTPNCVNGTCGLSSCTAPQADCNGQSGDGCEINTSNNPSHCGGCGNACFVANGTGGCAASSCSVASCNAGFANCNNLYADGCEKNLKTDPLNCNACGTVCSSVNGSASCNNGACSIACNPGYADCTASPGCETSTNTVANCGGCGVTCSNTHGSTACPAGVCVPTCASGWGDCDGDPKNGCETSLTTLTDCGACGSACALANANADCSTGTCQVTSCAAGYGNCNANPADGCETNTNTSVPHCGGCGSACSPNNGTPSCSAGNCFIACTSGYGNCNGNARVDGCEVNLTSDPLNCNTCGLACPPATPNCVGGSCISACPSGFADCDGIGANGCETNINTNHDKCGGCSNACGATQYCNTSVCTSCSGGLLDCDKNGANGCEADTATNPNACGSCGTKCGSDGTCGCSASACSGGTIYFSEDFSDNAKGWSLEGEWAIGPTAPSSGQQQGFPDPAQDHSTSSDNGVAGIVLGGNYANPVAGPAYITSPVINLSGAAGTVKLTLWWWMNIDWDPFVTDTLEVFNGTSWVVLYSSVSAGKNLITENSWSRKEYDVTAHKNANFRIRMSHKTGKQGNYLAWIMSGWNIDDVSLSSGTCN